jgi:predicted CXXCH cytochrome family protein
LKSIDSQTSSKLFTICKLLSVLLLFTLFVIFHSCSQKDEEGINDVNAGTGLTDHQIFVGSQTCQSCHTDEWEAWKGSHHDYAMAEASSDYVIGDFSDVVFFEDEIRYRFTRDGDVFIAEISEPGEEPERHEIVYTFGWEPLQQYLIHTGKGKYQALHIAWDTEREEWFSLQPDEQVAADDWLHWTGGAFNWNTMCADCHSTNLRQNYIAEADSFHTTWSDINVSCEACHGPGSGHVDFMQSDEAQTASPERIREDLNLVLNPSQMTEINTCAPCHSLRQGLTGEYIHGDRYLDHFDLLLPHPENYFADGQILEEVFVLGSFLQSKMFAHGVQCTDCHDPHNLELKATIHDNKLCMQCHEPEYNSPEHHFHEVNTEAAQCVNCHMTGRYYMEVDYRRDHSFRIPRPDQSVEFGTPNACMDCHGDQSPEWAADAIEVWYGESRPENHTDVFLRANAGYENSEEDLIRLIFDPEENEIIRATGVWYLTRYGTGDRIEVLRDALESESPLVRSSAAKAASDLSGDIRRRLLGPLVEDSFRSVRIAALQSLQEFNSADFLIGLRDSFREAHEEYRKYLAFNQYFPQGQMNLGQYYESRGDIPSAVDAYERTLVIDPYFYPAMMNLSYLFNSLGENERAEELLRKVFEVEPGFGQAYYSLALLLAEMNRLDESVDYFEQAADLMPENGRVYYNWAISLQTLNRPDDAENAYNRAIELEPENGDYLYGIITLYIQQNEYESAYEQALILNSLYPGNPQVQQMIQYIEGEL